MIENQPLSIKGFSGGLADEELSVTPQHYTRADNLLLTPEYDLISRPGSVLFDVAHAQLPSGNARVNGLLNYDQDTNLLAISGIHAYAYTAGNWAAINGATGDALHTGTTAASLSTAEWKKHIFLASSELLSPVKIYKDNSSAFQVVTAGLPIMATPINYVQVTVLANAITLANDIRTKMIDHFADVVQHKSADSASSAIITSGAATTLPTLLTLVAQLQRAYLNHFNDYQGPSVYHSAETNNVWTTVADQTLSNTIAPTTLEETVVVINELATRYNEHWGKVDTHLGSNAYGGHGASTSAAVTAALVFGAFSGPYVDLDRAKFYSVLNALRASLLNHIADYAALPQTTSAHKANDATHATDITNNYPVCNDPYSFAKLLYGLAGNYEEHENDAFIGAPTYHVHTEASPHSISYLLGLPVSTLQWDNLAGCAVGNWTKAKTRLNELLQKYVGHIGDAALGTSTNAHQAGTNHYITSGVNPATLTQLYTADYSVGAPVTSLDLGTYTYAFTYAYTYTTTGGVTFESEGPPLLVEAENVLKPEVQGLLLQGLVALANSGSTNYDVSNVKINIYRTTNGGQTLFYVDQVANGVTSYTDYTTDLELQTRNQIYTAGGVSFNYPAPPSKFVHIVDGYGYWGNVLDTDGTPRPNRIRQSIAGSPDAVPGDYFVDLPYPVTGVSSIRGIRVAWTKKATYRLEGTIDELGNGSISAVAISDSVGCSGGYGIVSTDQGLVFPGPDGFYITNGNQVSKLSRDWRTTYLNLVRSDTIGALIYGAIDKKTKRVWFTTSSTGSENDSCYILDLNLQLGENGPWTTASNRTYFAPSSICVFNDQIIRGDSRGYVFKHDESYTSDPKVNTGTAASTWTTVSIFPDYRSPANDFGSIMTRKFVPKIVVKAKNKGNMSLQINSINDGGKNIAALAPIRYRGGTTYGDPTLLSVGGGPTISGGGLPEYKRHFPAGSLRCATKQLQFILAKVAITESDTLSSGTLNHAAKTLTVAGATFADLVDHVLALDNDGYVQEYTITANTGTVITVSDPGNVLPVNGTYKWVVRGYPKDEKWQICSYLLYFNLFGTTQLFDTTSNGENA